METLTHCRLCNSDNLISVDNACNITRCQSCGYVFDNPRPTLEEITQYYSRPTQYDDWLSSERDRERLWYRRLKKLRKHDVCGSLLDVGAGIGQFLNMARPYFSEVSGTEVSTTAARIAREKYGIAIVENSLGDIDFGDRRFNTITLFHVLEHVHDPLEVIRKCNSLLHDKGILLIAVPNELETFRRRVRHSLNRLGLSKIKYQGILGIPKIVLDGSLPEIHLSHFTASVLADTVSRNGFTVVENDLDPYYVKHGVTGVLNTAYYPLMRVLMKLTGRNYYDTIWLVARKRG